MSESIVMEGSSTARTLTSAALDLLEDLPIELREHVTQLRLIAPAISVSIIALNAQNAEQDQDIASVLSNSACAPLDTEIERLEEILESIVEQIRLQEACV
jgi:hypothetical protein